MHCREEHACGLVIITVGLASGLDFCEDGRRLNGCFGGTLRFIKNKRKNERKRWYVFGCLSGGLAVRVGIPKHWDCFFLVTRVMSQLVLVGLVNT